MSLERDTPGPGCPVQGMLCMATNIAGPSSSHQLGGSMHVETQVEDDAEGPTTKREYEVARVPVGAALNGQAVNFLGCPQGSQFPLGMDAQLPLLNDQLDMKSREQINTPLFTGVKVQCHSCCKAT